MSTSSGSPVSPGGSTPSQGGSPIPSTPSQGGHIAYYLADAGDVLQTSTTVTSLAVALTALFPTFPSLAKMELFKVGGHWSILLGPILLFCGMSALFSSFWSLDLLRRKAGISSIHSMLTSSPLGLLFLALILFACIYVGVAASYVFS